MPGMANWREPAVPDGDTNAHSGPVALLPDELGRKREARLPLSVAVPGRLGSGVPPGTTVGCQATGLHGPDAALDSEQSNRATLSYTPEHQTVIPAGNAGIPRTYRQKDWWHQGVPGTRRR